MSSKRLRISPTESRSAENYSEIRKSSLPERELSKQSLFKKEYSRAASKSENQFERATSISGPKTLIGSKISKLKLLQFRNKCIEERS
jgi:hypothetical protein